MTSIKEVILEYVCPAFGTVIAIFMFLAPVRDLKAAIAKGDLGYLNPSPWAFLLGNCLGGLLYGGLLKNMWVFACNAIGVVISLWLNLGAIKLLYQGHHSKEVQHAMVALLEQKDIERGLLVHVLHSDTESSDSSVDSNSTSSRPELSHIPTKAANDWATIIYQVASQLTPAPARHEAIVIFLCGLWLVLGTVVVFVDAMDVETKASMVGAVTTCILVTFYAAPLSTISKVVKEKNSSTIHVPTMINNTLSGVFWCIYGFAIDDYFVYGPNGLSIAFGIIQILLCMSFPRNPKSELREDPKDLTEKTEVRISSIQSDSSSIQDVEAGTEVASA